MEMENATPAASLGSDETSNEVQSVSEPSQAPVDDGDSQHLENSEVDSALSPAQARIQKLANENRQFKSEMKALRDNFSRYGEAIKFHEAISKDPQKFKQVMDILLSNGNPAQAQDQNRPDPYAEYSPEVQELFKDRDALKQWRAEQERQRQETHLMSIEENKQNLETHFNSKLKEKGFIAENGEFDEREVDIISSATLKYLMQGAANPEKPTALELDHAFQKALAGLSAYEKRTLRKAVKPIAPLSGSNKGAIPAPGKAAKTDEERIMEIANSI